MIYQNVMCIGDSQTFGARAILGYPEYLPSVMKKVSSYTWSTINKGVNGNKAIDVLRRVDELYVQYKNVMITFFFIGTNDCNRKTLTKPEIFSSIYEQILNKLNIYEQHTVIATIPTIYPQEGHLPYDYSSVKHSEKLNSIVLELADKYSLPLVDLRGISKEKYLDSVHLNDDGNLEIAERFAQKLITLCAIKEEGG